MRAIFDYLRDTRKMRGGCAINRSISLECDQAIALGNPSLGYSPLLAQWSIEARKNVGFRGRGLWET